MIPQLKLLPDGCYYEELHARLTAARRRVYVSMFLFSPRWYDKTVNLLADFTAASQRELGYHAVLAFHGGMDVADRQRSAYLARYPARYQAEARQRFAAEVKEARQRELAFFARIGVDSAITSYGYQHFPRIMRQYKAWSYSLPMLRRFGVGPISISDNERWLPRPANDGLLMIVAPQRYGCLPAGRVTDLLYDCVTDQPLPLSLLGD